MVHSNEPGLNMQETKVTCTGHYNSADARPMSGLLSAHLVIEASVPGEGACREVRSCICWPPETVVYAGRRVSHQRRPQSSLACGAVAARDAAGLGQAPGRPV